MCNQDCENFHSCQYCDLELCGTCARRGDLLCQGKAGKDERPHKFRQVSSRKSDTVNVNLHNCTLSFRSF